MNILSFDRINSTIVDALTSWSNRPALPKGASPVPNDTRLSGATFAEQEPDLAKEAGVTGRATSGWAMAGSSLPD